MAADARRRRCGYRTEFADSTEPSRATSGWRGGSEVRSVSRVAGGDSVAVTMSPINRLVFARARKRKCEARTFPFGTLDGEIAFHCPGEIAAYRQSQSNAALSIGEALVQLDEWLEYGFQFVRGNARPSVTDA